MLCISNELPTVNPETIETSVNEVIEPIAIETTNNVVNFADYRSKVSQVSVNEPIEVETISDNPSANLETLGFPKADISTNPQDSTQELDRFEVTYQVADLGDEVSYEARIVYAYNHDHAKAIVSSALQAQHARYIITGCEYALVIDDLSEFSLVDEF